MHHAGVLDSAIVKRAIGAGLQDDTGLIHWVDNHRCVNSYAFEIASRAHAAERKHVGVGSRRGVSFSRDAAQDDRWGLILQHRVSMSVSVSTSANVRVSYVGVGVGVSVNVSVSVHYRQRQEGRVEVEEKRAGCSVAAVHRRRHVETRRDDRLG